MGFKVMAIVAHDNDAILGLGGQIYQHISNGDEVIVVIVTDGRNSHKMVLGVEKNPTPDQVKEARHREIVKALGVLGVETNGIIFLNEIDAEGERWQDDACLREKIRGLIATEFPDIIYFHGVDTHDDHRAVNLVVLKVLANLCYKPGAYTFTIWAKKVAREGPEHDLRFAPAAVSRDAIVNEIEPDVIACKREAIAMMHSLVSPQPYGWPKQSEPILGKDFIEFLLPKEVFVEIQ